MKALVTGGTGFVGGAIVRELIRRGHEVRALARTASKTEQLESLGVEIAPGDILDRPSLERALDGCGILYHAAAIYELWTPDPGLLMRTQVEGARNALEAAVAVGVDKVVYTSTAAAVGEPKGVTGDETTVHRGYYLAPYEEAKHKAELVARGYKDRLKLVIIRPAGVLGPGDLKPTGKSIVAFLNGELPALFDGEVTFVDIEDVARAHVTAAGQERWGESYILAAQVLSIGSFYGMIARMAGVKMPPMVPAFLARLFAEFEEWKAGWTGRPPVLSRSSFAMTTHGFRVDGSKAARELGFTYTPVEESLRHAIQWYWDQGLLKRKPDCVG